MDQNIVWLALAVIMAVCFLYSLFKRQRNLSAAQEGEDLRQLRQAVAKVLPDESGYQVVCAHYERSTHSGRTTTIYHYTYAIAFSSLRMWVIPLGFETGQLRTQSPLEITGGNVGVVEVIEKRRRDQLSQVQVTLRDKEGGSPLSFYVDPQNLKSDRFHHFNIDQQEECETFARFITSLAQKINAENRELQDRLAAEQDTGKQKYSKVLGILSILLCWLPLIGILLGAIGLFTAPKPKDAGGKVTSGFVLSLIGLALSFLVPNLLLQLLF